jgi:hypothetical protein
LGAMPDRLKTPMLPWLDLRHLARAPCLRHHYTPPFRGVVVSQWCSATPRHLATPRFSGWCRNIMPLPIRQPQ